MIRSELSRSLGTWDAIAIGVASMVGAGVFVVWGPATAAAGAWLPAALLLAGLVAWCNATSSAQLAAQLPRAGGSYLFGRELLGPWPGFLAGWSFLIGKTASSAAMALAFAAYLVPEAWIRPVGIVVVWGLVLINCLGVTRTALLAKVLAVLALAGIATALAAGWRTGVTASFGWVGGTSETPYGVLQGAGLLFFAFAGYARIATMGEEVRDPTRTIPRAILGALCIAFAIYAVVGGSLYVLVGPAALAGLTAPLTALVEGRPVARAILTFGAAAAIAGALLGLLSGIGRTWLAMAREADLPRFFDHTHPHTKVPHRIEITLGVILTGILLVADLRGAIGFSSFAVLLYYLVTNLAALRQRPEHRRHPKGWQVLGATLCCLLAFTLPPLSVALGLAVLAAGAGLRLLRLRALR